MVVEEDRFFKVNIRLSNKVVHLFKFDHDADSSEIPEFFNRGYLQSVLLALPAVGQHKQPNKPSDEQR